MGVIFSIGLLGFLICGRLETIVQRGSAPPLRESVVLPAMQLVSVIALMVWAFSTYAWYVPILAFIGLSLIGGFLPHIPRPDAWVYWYRIKPVFEVATIASASFLWTTGWP